MDATMDDAGTTLPTAELTSEQSGMTDIGMQVIEIDSLNETVRMELRKSEMNNDETTTLALKSLLPRLTGLQSSLRKHFDTLANPLIRKLHIFSLPEEILVMICKEVRGDIQPVRFVRAVANFKDIKSLRLTCRRFCGSSSHLLIHELSVSLTESSLKRLHEVSLHPAISKGVRNLRICVALQNPASPTSLTNFIHQVYRKLKKDYQASLLNMVNHLYLFDADADSIGSSWRPGYGPPSSFYTDRSINNLREHKEALLSCDNYLRTRAFSSSDDEVMNSLLKVHKKCIQLRLDQERLLHSDFAAFAARVATAVKRMPTITDCFITDLPDEFEKQEWDETLQSKRYFSGIQEELLEPKFCEVSEATSLLKRPLLYQLPVAVARGGNRLTKLEMFLCSKKTQKVALGEQHIRELGGVAEHLEELWVTCTVAMRDIHTERRAGDPATLTEMMSLLLPSKKLRSVSLCFRREGGGPQRYEAHSAGPLLALLPWANLRRISLQGISINYKEFRGYLEKLQPGAVIMLSCVHLLSGHWADLLDVLREKANSESYAVRSDDQGA
ncbi:hypothetical protein KVR01_010636 [Diaporthe batatas]|uniref:uncharacterized protein n=1 Tax=Diaporthe batatas TaxID=748121 RepID=UPI001D05B6CB|nr:uncharacterized protein KVR01_010636 [Diaporthe batatas]KAG8159999.1 hypothetical protein KVR01_010636 [Diaporthe batatas]